MLADITQRFLSDLSGAQDLHEASILLGHYSQSLPVRRAAFENDLGSPKNPVGIEGEQIGMELGWPLDFVRRWVESGLVLACPLLMPCKKMRKPFCWDLDDKDLGMDAQALPRPFTAMGQQTISLLRQVGVRSGITVPVHHPGGRTGFVTWVSDEPYDRMQRLADSRGNDLFIVAHSFLDRIDAMMRTDDEREADNCPLTDRERECLNWVACGKTDGEIGIIIDRSPETARFHVRNAIAKLDASSRSHAVAKAIRRGWLDEVE